MLQSIVSLTVNIRMRLCFPAIEHDSSFQEPAHKASADLHALNPRVIGIGVAGASAFHEPSTIRSVTTVLVGHVYKPHTTTSGTLGPGCRRGGDRRGGGRRCFESIIGNVLWALVKHANSQAVATTVTVCLTPMLYDVSLLAQACRPSVQV